MFASLHQIERRIVFADCNKLLSLTKLEKILELEKSTDAKMCRITSSCSYLKLIKSKRIQ
jgi:hypothetical protein